MLAFSSVLQYNFDTAGRLNDWRKDEFHYERTKKNGNAERLLPRNDELFCGYACGNCCFCSGQSDEQRDMGRQSDMEL